MKKIPENLIIVLKSLFPLLIIVVLFFILGKTSIKKMQDIQAQIKAVGQDKAVLNEKLDLLRSVAATGTRDSNEAVAALPVSNPSLAVVSQLKAMALQNGLLISTIKARKDPEEDQNIQTLTVSFSIVGAKNELNNFLRNIGTLAPITRLNTVKVSESSGTYSGEVIVNSFWAPLPTYLPASIQEFQDFTPSDKEILKRVNTLTPPVSIEAPPAGEGGKVDPFAD
jgi:Tfp pilus assembly protein PilO